MRGLDWANRGAGYELLTRHYGCFDSPGSARRDLHRRVKPGAVSSMWLMWHVAAGMSGNTKNQG